MTGPYRIDGAQSKGSHLRGASTGNTSASAAAYAARRGDLVALWFCPLGKIALANWLQAFVCEQKSYPWTATSNDALRIVIDCSNSVILRRCKFDYPDELPGKARRFRNYYDMGERHDFQSVACRQRWNISRVLGRLPRISRHG